MQHILDKFFKYDVFICHSSKDNSFLESLINDFKKENISYWVDAEQIDFGDSITEKITEGLETSNYVIPCVSKNLKNSGWTRAEYGSILNAEFSGYSKRRVIPLMLEECDVNDIPTLLRDKRRVTYSNKIEFNEFINFLKKDHLKDNTPNSPSSPTGSSNSKSRSEEIPNTFTSHSTGIEFVRIPVGEFMMGSPFNEQGRYDNEGPVHKVTIKNSFYMGKYPVTKKQWEIVMGSSLSNFMGEDYPVESVSWNEVQEFIKKLNEVEGTCKYRLPSEAEWEYACRAGSTTKYSFGDDDSKLADYAWYSGYEDLFNLLEGVKNYNDRLNTALKNHDNFNFEGNTYPLASGENAHPVGQKKPNSWGLYDMHGNVREWCQDKWHNNYQGAPSDGSAWEDGSTSQRIRRGGSHDSLANDCRSAVRLGYFPDNYYENSLKLNIGFRLLREI